MLGVVVRDASEANARRARSVDVVLVALPTKAREASKIQ